MFSPWLVPFGVVYLKMVHTTSLIIRGSNPSVFLILTCIARVEDNSLATPNDSNAKGCFRSRSIINEINP